MKEKLPLLKAELFLVFLMASIFISAQIQSAQTCPWNSDNDQVIITAGHMVSVSSGITRNALTTVSSTLRIAAGGYLTGNGPQYQVGSELRYGSGGIYNRNIEWGWGAVTYKPYHVAIEYGTPLNLGANGAVNQELEVRGNLTVEVNGNLYVDFGVDQMNQPIAIKGNATVEGQLFLSNNLGGDIKINGDFAFGNN